MQNARKPVILVSTGLLAHPMSARRAVSALYGAALERAGLLAAAALGGDADALAAQFDGLLLSGGGDLDASLFGQAQDARAGAPDRARDLEELALCAAFCAQGKPVLGVCRGMQVLNVCLGGDILQHIDGHDGAPHAVHAAPGSRIARLCGPRFRANSFHHQAVGRLGDGLCAAAHAPDGVIEAIEHEKLPILGVQWHPERMASGLVMDTDADHTALFAWMKQKIKDREP